MVKIGVCIETVFTDYPYSKRVEEVAKLGFSGIEFWSHNRRFDGKNETEEYKDMQALAKLTNDLGLEVSDFVLNTAPGDNGGSLVKPEDRETYLSRLQELIPLAHELKCSKLITCTGNTVEGKSYEEQRESIIDILSEAAKVVEKEGIILLVEPLNTLVDHPGYFLDSPYEAAKIIEEINHPNIKLLYDIYHMQIMSGNVIPFIKRNIDIIGHFHAAGVPGRHELWIGELSYPYIFEQIDNLGYNGYFGLEYWPTIESKKSLKKTIRLLLRKELQSETRRRRNKKLD